MAVLGLRCCVGIFFFFLLVLVNRGYSPVAVGRLLITVASLVAKRGL